MKISVIIPTFMEEENIGKLVKTIKKQGDYEVIVVDDNSPDKTREIAIKNGAFVIRRTCKGNIFTAIQDGINFSRSDIVVTMDADLSHPPEKIPDLISEIEFEGYDMASGSRYIKGGDVKSPLKRSKYFSLILNQILRIFLGIKQKDITGGFHAIRKSAFNKLTFKNKYSWGEFDIEWFYRAKQIGLKIKEVPFIYEYRKKGNSKSKAFKYLWIYFIMALKLRFEW